MWGMTSHDEWASPIRKLSINRNGKLHQAAKMFKAGKKGQDIVQVCVKIRYGMWTDNVTPWR
jgi:hypothetical protein